MTAAHRVFRALSAAALALLLMAAAACASSPSDAQVVMLWHSLTGAKEQALLDLVDRWNETNPYRITVTPERRDQAALHNGVLNGSRFGAVPGLVLASPMQVDVYQQRNILADLTPFVSSADGDVGWTPADRADLYPFVLTAGRATDGRILGIPQGGTARVMVYNRDWLKSLNFDALPSDWEQYMATCANAADRAKGTLCFGASTDDAAFQEWALANGARIMAASARVMQLAAPNSLEAINRLDSFVRANQAYRSTTQSQSREDFAAARVLYAFDWSDQLPNFRRAIRERGNFDWDVGLLPSTVQAPAAPFRAPLWAVPKSTPQRELAAWKFIRWMLDEPQTAEWSARTGELPARLSAVNDAKWQQQADPLMPAVMSTFAPAVQPEPLISGWGCIQDVLKSVLRDIYDGKPVTDTLTVAQYTAQTEVDYDCSLK